MDSMIPNGQKSTLAEYMILSGADNRLLMLDKPLYDSWKSRMELYMQNREHGRMILESVEHGPLDWPSIEVDGVTRLKKYTELSAFEKLQANFNQQTHLAEFPQIDSGLAVPVFNKGDYPIYAINKMMSFLSTVVTSRFPTTNNQLRNSSNSGQQATIHDRMVTVQPVQGRQSSYTAGTSGTKANISGTGGNNSGQQRVVKCFNCHEEADPRVAEGPVTQTVITHNATYQADDLDAYDSDCDDFSTAKAVLMANLSSDVLSEVVHIVLWYMDSKCLKHMTGDRS
ncbi:hypothetical protein Tco_1254017 [Tanacetum coccineum]